MYRYLQGALVQHVNTVISQIAISLTPCDSRSRCASICTREDNSLAFYYFLVLRSNQFWLNQI